MELGKMHIGREVLAGGEEIFVPYIKEVNGDIVPYEPFYTVKEAMQWILEQNPVLPLRVLNKVAMRMQCPKMRTEALKFIADTNMVNKDIAGTIVRLSEIDEEMRLALEIYPVRAKVVVYGEFYKKVCGINGNSIESNGIKSTYKYQIVQGFATGSQRLKSYQQTIGNKLVASCHEPLSGDLNTQTVLQYLREHHQL